MSAPRSALLSALIRGPDPLPAELIQALLDEVAAAPDPPPRFVLDLIERPEVDADTAAALYAQLGPWAAAVAYWGRPEHRPDAVLNGLRAYPRADAEMPFLVSEVLSGKWCSNRDDRAAALAEVADAAVLVGVILTRAVLADTRAAALRRLDQLAADLAAASIAAAAAPPAAAASPPAAPADPSGAAAAVEPSDAAGQLNSLRLLAARQLPHVLSQTWDDDPVLAERFTTSVPHLPEALTGSPAMLPGSLSPAAQQAIVDAVVTLLGRDPFPPELVRFLDELVEDDLVAQQDLTREQQRPLCQRFTAGQRDRLHRAAVAVPAAVVEQLWEPVVTLSTMFSTPERMPVPQISLTNGAGSWVLSEFTGTSEDWTFLVTLSATFTGTAEELLQVVRDLRRPRQPSGSSRMRPDEPAASETGRPPR